MQPATYTPVENFAEDEANAVAGRATVLTSAVDAELAAIATSINALCLNLGLIQRDDTQLRDGVVSAASLSAEVLALIGSSTGSRWTPRGNWVTLTVYAALDMIQTGGVPYLCVTAHTSGVFAADLAAGKWMVLGASGVFTNGVIGGSLTVGATLTVGGLTAGRVPYLAAAGLFTDNDAMKFDGKALTLNDATAALILGAAPAAAGAVRLSNATLVRWRDAANDADAGSITVDAANDMYFDSAIAGTNVYVKGGGINVAQFVYLAAGDRWFTLQGGNSGGAYFANYPKLGISTGDTVYVTSNVAAAFAKLIIDHASGGYLVAGGPTTPAAGITALGKINSDTAIAIQMRNLQAGGYGSVLSWASLQNFGANTEKVAATIATTQSDNWTSNPLTSMALVFSTISANAMTENFRIDKGVFKLAANVDIEFGRALVALGGGAAPTLGTIGGGGPATAAQNTWAKFLDNAGIACFVPVWK